MDVHDAEIGCVSKSHVFNLVNVVADIAISPNSYRRQCVAMLMLLETFPRAWLKLCALAVPRLEVTRTSVGLGVVLCLEYVVVTYVVIVILYLHE